jgi:uncharacterized repeat protein (TIGR01451 family)
MKKNYLFIFSIAFTLLVGYCAHAQSIVFAQDDFGHTPLSAPGQVVIPNILANDVLDAHTPSMSEVTITKLFQTSQFVDIEDDGSVAVAFPGPQMAGTYIIVYRIAPVIAPNNAATAIIRVVVGDCGVAPPVVGIITQPTCGGTGTVALSGLPSGNWALNVVNHNGDITQITGGTSNAVVGDLTFGSYTLSVWDPLNDCVSPSVTVLMPDADCGLLFEMQGTYQDYNNDGVTNPGDVINYAFSLTNNTAYDFYETEAGADVWPSPLIMTTPPTSGPALAVGQTNNTFYTGRRILTQQDINLGHVYQTALGYGYSMGGSVGTYAVTDTYLQINDGIKFVAFVDVNENGTKDDGEANFPYAIFNYEINGDGVVHNIPAQSGVHVLQESDPGNVFHLGITIDPQFADLYAASASYQNVTVAQGSGLTTYNFAVTVIPYIDVAVFAFPQNLPRPGFVFTNQIMYINQGNSPIASGTVTFTKDSALTITDISQPGTTPTADGFTFDFTNLMPNETRFITVLMQVPVIPNVALGNLLSNSVAITVPQNDIHPLNNSYTVNQVVVGSYDPNDKTENHGGKILHSSFTENDYLTYTIRFENSGTAEAINVKVNDMLDAGLDETSVRMVTASHPYVLDRIGNNLAWRFDAIQLPPAVADTNIGHGYVVFQVKPKPGYAVGDTIPNTADIYFDFNPAIVTNTVETEFVSTLAVKNFDDDQITVYPNPVHNLLNIYMRNRADANVQVMDVLGKIVLSKNTNGQNTQLELSDLSNGMYFVKVNADGDSKTFKIIKQ